MRDSDQDVAPSVRDRFNTAAARITSTLGSPYVLTVAVVLVVLWAVSGPFFQFSEEWQLIINTTTTIITFLMVFVIQASQNRDSKAIHLKLDEVIRAVGGARNEMIGAEREGEAEIRRREAEFLPDRRGGHDPGARGASRVRARRRRRRRRARRHGSTSSALREGPGGRTERRRESERLHSLTRFPARVRRPPWDLGRLAGGLHAAGKMPACGGSEGTCACAPASCTRGAVRLSLPDQIAVLIPCLNEAERVGRVSPQP